jgi:hypothetical protein
VFEYCVILIGTSVCVVHREAVYITEGTGREILGVNITGIKDSGKFGRGFFELDFLLYLVNGRAGHFQFPF